MLINHLEKCKQVVKHKSALSLLMVLLSLSLHGCGGKESASEEPKKPVKVQYTVTIQKPENGTISGGGIQCGTVCSISVDSNASITLSATSAEGFSFLNWTNGCTGTSSECSLVVTSDMTISAEFQMNVIADENVSVIVDKPQSGRVSGNTINCGETCSVQVKRNSLVALTAAPDSGFLHSGWTGVCAGQGLTCEFNATQDSTTVSALFAKIVSGALYLSPGGTGVNCTLADPCGTFLQAFSVMSSGDTLIVQNGTYHQNMGEWHFSGGIDVSTSNPPSGTIANPTVIKAQTEGQVNIIGDDVELFLDASYVEISGFNFISNTGQIARIIGNNNQLKNSSFRAANANNDDGLVSLLGDNNLMEDCWVYGSGQFAIIIGRVYDYSGLNNTLRRVVVRLDNYIGSRGYIGIVLYNADGATFDNVFVLDLATSNTNFGYKGGIRSRFGGSDHKFYGTMVLNAPYDGFISSSTRCENCVAWDIKGRGIWQEKYASGHFSQITVGDSTTGAKVYDNAFDNTLIVNSSGANDIGGQYNHFYNSISQDQGADFITDDPQLKYITQIEAGTPGYNSGLNGTSRGANITHRYENGVLTQESLWPFPNEVRMLQDMCDSTYLTSAGRTGVNLPGMCAGGNGLYGGPKTFTSYIWEYLGNPCPQSICLTQ